MAPAPLQTLADPYSLSLGSAQLVYLWSRLNPLVRLSLFGIITITAPYLPYALCLFSWALSSGGGAAVGMGGGWGLGVIVSDLLGIAAGHWWCVASPSAIRAARRSSLPPALFFAFESHGGGGRAPSLLTVHFAFAGTSGRRSSSENERRAAGTGSKRHASCASELPHASRRPLRASRGCLS